MARRKQPVTKRGAKPRAAKPQAAKRSAKARAASPRVGSFHIEQSMRVAAPIERAWASLIDVAGWWTHHFAPERPRMELEPVVGGKFFERWGEGCGALWGTVMHVEPPRLLRLHGPLGMGRLPCASVYEFHLEPAGGSGTRVRLVHRAHGLLDPAWKRAHEKGWSEMWPHLAALAERGVRYTGNAGR